MKWDLHIHSEHSFDCSTPLRLIFKTAEKKGLDGLAITDHDDFSAFQEARRLSAKFRIGYLPAMEVSTDAGDLIALGISSPIESRALGEVLEEVKEQGAVSIAAHPFDPFRGHLGGEAREADAVEVNSHSLFGNGKVRRFAEKHGLAVVGGSDAHTAWEVGSSYTLCDEPVEDIKHKKTQAVGGFNWGYMPVAASLHVATLPGRLWRWMRSR